MLDSFYIKLRTWFETEDYSKCLIKEKENERVLSDFLSSFSVENLSNMNIDNYITGKGNQFSFCNYVEKKLEDYGAMSRRTNAYQKFVLYWSDKINNYSFGDKRTKNRRGFGNNIDTIYDSIKNSIAGVVEASKASDYSRIVLNRLNPQFKNKIAYLYNHNNQVPIYSDDDLNVILQVLDIRFDESEDRAFKREKLFIFYKQLITKERLSPYLFMRFIYSDYGYRNVLRGKESIAKDYNKANDNYCLVDVDVDHITESSDDNDNRGIFNPVYDTEKEEIKKLVGKKAEAIVWRYLQTHKEELGIVSLYCWCSGQNRNDSKGYDFSYIDKEGKEIYIEVKGTSRKLGNRIEFEISSNEYSKLKERPNEYYIFFINDVWNGLIIKRLLGKDITMFNPTHYLVKLYLTE